MLQIFSQNVFINAHASKYGNGSCAICPHSATVQTRIVIARLHKKMCSICKKKKRPHRSKSLLLLGPNGTLAGRSAAPNTSPPSAHWLALVLCMPPRLPALTALPPSVGRPTLVRSPPPVAACATSSLPSTSHLLASAVLRLA
jgi:hypothetical protein